MQEVLLKYFPKLNPTQLEQFKNLEKVFPEWNNKINCISRKDIDNLFIHHILHSLSIALKFEFDETHTIADIGTGGGFPGLPLAIMFPKAKFDLVDSIAKKITVVSAMKNELNLQNVNAINSRAEILKPKYDFVISRAVTAFPNFYNLVKNIILSKTKHNKQGIIYLKGGNFDEELKEFKNFKIFNIYELMNYQHFETKKMIYLPVNKKTL
ncbi:MAG: 16S rRNA (guanine(527)-N(7))-methyltransferase RsmG [Bacteroidales bacterium]|jgi:16S rRNA (guanine527-N7)-methyltransferase|nr:16S rRNA (guanine(527)-N(7))-methyltransferase RsmG [Bacteroidales bacterium]MCK9499808.1 16S rRNA (guanine(527)-N(7))-methyltransferase RsmG [Bacteroidales bacterium]MDY0313942.1 16S rRNA (guanine(527)-N(7))-methyltransferase RsmG [Bacteroidales bacterium]NLB87281.1 16S rRNA (guanine(527)-N(7))-methyltransferase RsmG [Bacteroidales bacterium]